jgi:hypothetical protein
MLECTAASGRHDHTTFRKRADESVCCSGFWAKLLHAHASKAATGCTRPAVRGSYRLCKAGSGLVRVVWSYRPLAAVHACIALLQICPACSPLEVLRPLRSRRRRPLLPVGQ